MHFDRDNLIDTGPAEPDSLPLVRFDAEARANAKPVIPIPARKIYPWTGFARKLATPLTKTVALALAGGLAIGALGHTVLVQEGNAVAQDPVVQVAGVQATTADDDVDLDVQDVALPATGAVPNTKRSSVRRNRRLPGADRQPRAYCVGVLK